MRALFLVVVLTTACGEGREPPPSSTPPATAVPDAQCLTDCDTQEGIARGRCDREMDTCGSSATSGLSLGLCAAEHGHCRDETASMYGVCRGVCGLPREVSYWSCVGSCWNETGSCEETALFAVDSCSIGCSSQACVDSCFNTAQTALDRCTSNHNNVCLPACEPLH